MNMAKEGVDTFLAPSAGQFQIRVRQSKGNQELNDELRMKANELEKLFAEHKLRTPPGNKSNSNSRISRHTYMQSWPSIDNAFVNQVFDNDTFMEPTATFTCSNIDKSASTRRTKVADKNYSDELICIADGSPGKFYETYMQKRDAKLKEEWNSKGAEKEAKLRAMEDSFERSTAEMKTMERLRSFNSSSSFRRDQQLSVFGQSDNKEDMPEFMNQKRNDELRSSSETSSEEVSKPSTPRKKQHLPIKTSSKPRTIVASVPRSPMKVSSSPSYQRKSQPESPLARSVPNMSYMRKDNAEPYSPAGKTMTRTHYPRSKLLHSQSLRKSSGLHSEGVSLAPLKFDKDKTEQSSKGVILTPLKTGKDKMEQSLSAKFHNISDSKTLLKKGKDANFSSRGGLTETRGSDISSRFTHDHNEDDDDNDDDMELDSEDSEDRDEEDFENMTSTVEENLDNRTPILTHETEKVDSGSENRRFLRSFSQVCYASEDGSSPSSVPSNFLSGPVSQAHQYTFSYPHEMSDVDASDSPLGSPTSWNSHFLSPRQSDGAVRTRKKWGTAAQNPIHMVKSSQSLSRKDKARGFKRLLRFGSKNHGTNSLVKDWISATTPKGDGGTGNGHGNPNHWDDSLYEGVLLNDRVQSLHSSIPAAPANFKLREDHRSGSSIKAPRSFFSLSSFRSKGKDSKPR